jgi:small-conductance mechanosensitive channel
VYNRLRRKPDLGLDRMFETRSEAWERVGLTADVGEAAVRKARRQIAVLVPLLVGVLVVYALRDDIFGVRANSSWETPIQILTALALVALGWGIAGAVGKAAAPTFFRRMDPSTAGTVGFLIRLATIAITLIAALSIAQVRPSALVGGAAFTAVVLGLAAQQTLGNLFAGMVLISARPFRVGERVRLQAGGVAGSIEGVVSSQGLLYTTLARGDERVMIPNTVVLASAVMPLREPDSIDVRIRLTSGVRPSQVQAILDEQIHTPTRNRAKVLLEEIDSEDVVIRVQATPDHADDGAKLADEVIAALSSVTGEHEIVRDLPA